MRTVGARESEPGLPSADWRPALLVVHAGKLKAHELRNKGKQELLKQLDSLKTELASVRV